MKKQVLLNSYLSRLIAEMGHGDCLAISDAGLPIPPQTPRIDLAVCGGVPSLLSVFDVVVTELEVERAVIAREMRIDSPRMYGQVIAKIRDIAYSEISHQQLKGRLTRCKAVVRTGELTPFANIVLHAGAIF